MYIQISLNIYYILNILSKNYFLKRCNYKFLGDIIFYIVNKKLCNIFYFVVLFNGNVYFVY